MDPSIVSSDESLIHLISLLEFNYDCRHISLNVIQTDISFLNAKITIPIFATIYDLKRKIADELHDGAVYPDDIMIYLEKPKKSISADSNNSTSSHLNHPNSSSNPVSKVNQSRKSSRISSFSMSKDGKSKFGNSGSAPELQQVLDYLKVDQDVRFIEYYIKNKKHVHAFNGSLSSSSSLIDSRLQNSSFMKETSSSMLAKSSSKTFNAMNNTASFTSTTVDGQSTTLSVTNTSSSTQDPNSKSTGNDDNTHALNVLPRPVSRTSAKTWTREKLKSVLLDENIKSSWTIYYDVRCYSYPEKSEKPNSIRTCPILMQFD